MDTTKLHYLSLSHKAGYCFVKTHLQIIFHTSDVYKIQNELT